jgi:heat shock protein 4
VQLKKVLSSIPEAPLNVECLMNDLDFRSSITREKFEELAQPVLERMHAPLAQASPLVQFALHPCASAE